MSSDQPASASSHPYDDLKPDILLDAVEDEGFPVSGRLFALNSYENRVYQIGLDDAQPVIAKFYRPGRWSEAQILEEHRIPCIVWASGWDNSTISVPGSPSGTVRPCRSCRPLPISAGI